MVNLGMAEFPKKLQKKLSDREHQNALRRLPAENTLVDFSSNDYLGLSRNRELFDAASRLLEAKGILKNGATGSRLLSGNHPLYKELEDILCDFHQTESALVFNSGYDANIGFFGSVPQRGDIVFYDEYAHASIRDGIKMGNAKSYKFKHNDLQDLKKKCQAERSRNALAKNTEMSSPSVVTERSRSEAEVYVVTESVFSMDGDSPDLRAFADFCKESNCRLVIDEAHAVGVFGENGEGLVQYLGLQDAIFARMVTFGKAIGCHGAAVLGSKILKNYLVNFARSFIYTTGLPPHSVATILAAYENLQSSKRVQEGLKTRIGSFNLELEELRLEPYFIPSDSAIHCCIVGGNTNAKSIAKKIQERGFDIRPILSPTVPEGQERLRICLHSFNTKEEITEMLALLSNLLNSL